MSVIKERLKAGLFTENPLFVQILATCPALAVSTSITNAIGMGFAATAVLVASNVVISLLRKFIPDKIRIPAYITIIAAFVTIVQFLLEGFVPALYNSLGLFIPLIVVNCIILGRAEAYASKNSVYKSFWDGIGMGLGFTLALVALAFFRELIGSGTLLGYKIPFYQPALLLIMPPGGFIVFGFIMAGLNYYGIKRKKKFKDLEKINKERSEDVGEVA